MSPISGIVSGLVVAVFVAVGAAVVAPVAEGAGASGVLAEGELVGAGAADWLGVGVGSLAVGSGPQPSSSEVPERQTSEKPERRMAQFHANFGAASIRKNVPRVLCDASPGKPSRRDGSVIHSFVRGRHDGRAKAFTRSSGAAGAVELAQASSGGSQRFDIAARNEKPGHAFVDDFGKRTSGIPEHGRAAQHCFNGDQAKRLFPFERTNHSSCTA
jgi:hypothetical protein